MIAGMKFTEKLHKNTEAHYLMYMVSEAALKSGLNALELSGRCGLSQAVRSDFAKKRKKNVTNKYLDQALDHIISDLSKKIDPLHKSGAVEVHNIIRKLPKPKGGWTPPGYKYMGPYNPLEKQLEYDKNTGDVTKWHVK